MQPVCILAQAVPHLIKEDGDHPLLHSLDQGAQVRTSCSSCLQAKSL